MAIKIDELIEKFKEFKEELNKGKECAYQTFSKEPDKNAATGTSGGDNSIHKNTGQDMMAMSEKMNKDGMAAPAPSPTASPAPQTINQMIGSPFGKKESLKFDNNGQWKLDKVDPQENINIPHPKGKAKMSDGVNKDEDIDGCNREANPKLRSSDAGPGGKIHMVKDEGANEEAATSKPHNKGKFKVMDMAAEKESKREDVKGLPYNGKDKDVHKGEHQGNEAKGFDENKAPGRGTLSN